MATPVQLPLLPQSLPQTQADWQRVVNVLQMWVQALLPEGSFNSIFQSGDLIYSGPNGLTSDPNFEVGTNLPNPSGIPGPAFLLGSGGGNGTNVTGAIIQDQAFDTSTPGNDLIITAGETQPTSTARGGNLLAIAGASDLGVGGTMTVQGGTTVGGTGGEAILAGGNSTNGPAGDAFVIAGETGSQGGNVHLIATNVNGISGDVRVRINSTILLQFLSTGELFLTLSGTGSGTAGQHLTSQGPGLPAKWA